MSLYELLAGFRAEILEIWRERVQQALPPTAELERQLASFFDATLQSLQNQVGLDGADPAASLVESEAAAVRLGRALQQAELEPVSLPLVFGALCQAIGHTGERRSQSLSFADFRLLNQCLDASIATSIKAFWSEERAQRQQRRIERLEPLVHDLREALGNAALAFKLLRADNFAAPCPHANDALASNLVRMEAIVARSLGVMRLASPVPLDLRPIRVADVLRQLQASAIPDRAISVTLEVDESLHVNADEALLRSAVCNLVHNACKFSCSGALVTLTCRAEDRGVVIEVEDECGGLAPETLTRLYALFSAGDNDPEELGVGLTITKRAAEAMDGRVYLQNRPGAGCTFSLVFPRAVPARTSSAPPAQPAPAFMLE